MWIGSVIWKRDLAPPWNKSRGAIRPQLALTVPNIRQKVTQKHSAPWASDEDSLKH